MSDTLEEFIAEHGEVDEKIAIEALEHKGWLVHKPRPPEQVRDINVDKIRGNRIRLGVVSDLHLSSRYQQRTHLLKHLEYMRREKVSAILVGGDVTDGPGEMHPGHTHNLFNHLYTTQRDYAIAALPELGVPWYFISGNHDDSWIKNSGGEIVQDICAARDDFTYLGRSTGYVRLNDLLLALDHPHKGGAYAWSYNIQKYIEAISPERKPHVLLQGNFHKCMQLYYRNVLGFVLPSYQAQTPFMAGKGLVSVIGGLILEIGRNPKGLAPDVQYRWLVEPEAIPNDF